jgi:hypothetical protein
VRLETALQVNYPGGRLFIRALISDTVPPARKTRLLGEALQSFEDITHYHFQCVPAEGPVLHGIKSGVFF